MSGLDIDFGLLARDGMAARPAKAGETIFHEGDPAHDMFVIKHGHVAIRLGNRTLAELADRSIFGERALLDTAPRGATAVALTDCELVPISQQQFLLLVSQTPSFALDVMRVLARRLDATHHAFG
jgi:CRP/FNR family transcriptional regulator, cyclic AMP receptor protein